MRSALALDPTDGETKELAAHWNVAAPPPGRGRAPVRTGPAVLAGGGQRAPGHPTASGVIDAGVGLSGLSRSLSGFAGARVTTWPGSSPRQTFS